MPSAKAAGVEAVVAEFSVSAASSEQSLAAQLHAWPSSGAALVVARAKALQSLLSRAAELRRRAVPRQCRQPLVANLVWRERLGAGRQRPIQRRQPLVANLVAVEIQL